MCSGSNSSSDSGDRVSSSSGGCNSSSSGSLISTGILKVIVAVFGSSLVNR